MVRDAQKRNDGVGGRAVILVIDGDKDGGKPI
jgi:hypothetical protein